MRPTSEHAYKGWANFPVCHTPVVRGSDAREARKRIKATQVTFAAHMGVSSRTVKRWEQNPDEWITQPCMAREIKTILTWDGGACRR